MSDTTEDGPRRAAGAPPGRRPNGLARERAIVTAATDLFAEIGLDATTRDLAARLGITQPLLYRYFDSKEALVERVLAEALSGDWKPGWDRALGERAVPLRERLIAFYADYLDEVLTYRRVRLALFSGLKGLGEGLFQDLRARILDRVLRESRCAFSLPEAAGARDAELVRALHDSIFCLALRRHVHGWSPAWGMREMVAQRVDTFLEGAAVGMARPVCGEAPDTELAGPPLSTGGLLWAAAPDRDRDRAPRGAATRAAMVWEKNEATPQRAHD
ncbi:TetR/AcrR family transcriptional regulator [Muricoccus vinaceus]|uniref:TetR/AcrR family transcriptional regulator n=1 Tax=Muricoccus vinaceus TaxID=424704 RepID=A0ABV6IP60_9PROT